MQPEDKFLLDSVKYYDYTVYSDGTIENKSGRELKPRLQKDGHMSITLRLNKIKKYCSLARVIYHAFNPEFNVTDINNCVTFKDKNSQNCQLSNLYLAFRGDLIQGQKHKKAKLSEQQIKEIKSLYQGEARRNQYEKTEKPSLLALAEVYGVSKQLIASVVKKRHRTNYKLVKK
jgi:hypothetical protein